MTKVRLALVGATAAALVALTACSSAPDVTAPDVPACASWLRATTAANGAHLAELTDIAAGASGDVQTLMTSAVTAIKNHDDPGRVTAFGAVKTRCAEVGVAT